MKDKYKKLIKNTSIFALGSFSSKILSFLIVPLYTYVLSSSDYGKIDLVISTINLMLPFSTLLIYEAAIRFLIGKEYDEKRIFNNCFLIYILGLILSFFISPIILEILKLQQYFFIFELLLFFTAFSTIFGQYLRAKNDNWGFSISGIISTFSLVFFNLFFLLVLKKGLSGYIISLILSQIITSIFIAIRCHFFSNINLAQVDFTSLKKMLLYSIPLVPNNIMWWIMNTGDKYVINIFLGHSFNGIFSIAYKIPTIITMIFSIFMQAWQVSAIEENSDKSRNLFYKNVFNYISLMLIICATLIILFVNPLFNIIIGDDFKIAWTFVPTLCVATLFNCFSTFAGIVYIVNKDSKGSFFTTFVGAITNLLCNLLLISKFGLFGVSLGTVIGYAIVMIIRFRDFKKEFNILLIDKKIKLLMIIVIFDSIVYTFTKTFFKYIFSVFCLLLIFVIYKKEINSLLSKVKRKYNNT